MLKSFLFAVLSIATLCQVTQASNDTLVIQAFSHDDPSPEGWSTPYRGHLNFPDDGSTYSKILMVQHLKCDERTMHDSFACGEWDYHTQYSLLVPKGDTTELFNLVSFITPYGIRLKMGGENGWKWVYDITDYAPLLKGEVDIIAGNNQELLGLSFLFIKGEPARPCLKVENIYPYANYKYEYLADDSLCKAVKIHLDPKASGYAIKSAISGHGHSGPRNCCEWDSKTHSIYINEEDRFRWNVWKDCGFNAIYPQGGTWPFDRAGWCPGTPVDEYWFQLTPLVKPGDTITLDYGIEAYSDNGEKDGEFRMSHQLFTYGAFSHQSNAAVIQIISPSDADAHSRVNPSCNEVSLIIRNEGSLPLISAEIMFGIIDPESGQLFEGRSEHWRGLMHPMETARITLEYPGIHYMAGMGFYAGIYKANGIEADYLDIAQARSVIPEHPILPESFIIRLHTNNLGRASENCFTISSSDGTLVFSGGELLDDSTFIFPVTLPEGCYSFRFLDDRQDGISRHWWNRGSEPEKVGINGKLGIYTQEGEEIISFPPDFGQEILYRFRVEP